MGATESRRASARRPNVSSIPTLAIFKRGQIADRWRSQGERGASGKPSPPFG
jgi:hypothetical protein